ncbi:M23 family metallopeptidase [Candidatus Pelagibacter sp.]|jgi:murein DD-endopeptidase MepM/ murein hydrolase activator NlpD|nr:M23 family metallopeptidase [Candidatus Pelagibacter sp.]MDB9923553.1 M23 family metallopeptidase [Candidatus Pelagibacter sp.]|tara:strand:- start:901 stop:1704 length:804 start_codon:yes stop_codon:yes gene_type:complete
MDSSIIHKFFLVLLILTTSQVKAVEFQGKFIQGHFILGKTDPNAKIIVGKKEVKVSKDGFFVFGIDRDRKFDLTFTKILDDKKSKITKKVLKRKYNIQRIDGLEESKVTPPESVYKRIKKENNAIGEARAINSNLNFFKDKFIMPVEGIISGVYGSQRILNGKPKWPHYGIDIAAKQGTMIKSSGTGVVTMAEDDLYYTGGTIIMDHGHGISTIYSHLENTLVSVGDQINQGDVIGTVGSTGRSTGPHLDFRINWFQTRLDPMSVLK